MSKKRFISLGDTVEISGEYTTNDGMKVHLYEGQTLPTISKSEWLWVLTQPVLAYSRIPA